MRRMGVAARIAGSARNGNERLSLLHRLNGRREGETCGGCAHLRPIPALYRGEPPRGVYCRKAAGACDARRIDARWDEAWPACGLKETPA